MSGFFKKTLSFLGLSDEDEVGLENTEEKDRIRIRNRKLKEENNAIKPVEEKEYLRREHVLISKQPRKSHFAHMGKDTAKSRVFIARPVEFDEIQIIADNFKDNIPIIINLQETNQDLAKRIIDFCSGLTYALEGNIKKVAEKVFLITPYNVEISSEDKELLREEGLYDQF
jgi:cell division inhibitor SepF